MSLSARAAVSVEEVNEELKAIFGDYLAECTIQSLVEGSQSQGARMTRPVVTFCNGIGLLIHRFGTNMTHIPPLVLVLVCRRRGWHWSWRVLVWPSALHLIRGWRRLRRAFSPLPISGSTTFCFFGCCCIARH